MLKFYQRRKIRPPSKECYDYGNQSVRQQHLPGTLAFLNLLTTNHVMPTFINVTGSIALLKEFITFRDTSPLYDGTRGTGAIGFPLVELEDGTRTRDIPAVLKSLGIEAEWYFK